MRFLKRLFFKTLLLLPLVSTDVYAAEQGVKLYFLDQLVSTTPGEIRAIRVMVTNPTNQSLVLVSHLELPPNWKPIPYNDILVYMAPMETQQQVLLVQVPEDAEPGEYEIVYRVWDRTNFNMQDEDRMTVEVYSLASDSAEESTLNERSPEEPATEENLENTLKAEGKSPSEELAQDSSQIEVERSGEISLALTSPSSVELHNGEVTYVSALLKNQGAKQASCKLNFKVPEGWEILRTSDTEIIIPAHESVVEIIGLRVPNEVLAGDYFCSLEQDGNEEKKVIIGMRILPQIEFNGEIENLKENYSIETPVDLKVKCFNNGNAPLRLQMSIESNMPARLRYKRETFEIPAFDSSTIPVSIIPLSTKQKRQHKVFVKIENADTGEILFYRVLYLNIIFPGSDEKDPYIRIPSRFSTMFLSDNNYLVGAAEWEGGGIIDPDRDRELQFCFRIPTERKNVLYNMEQRLFLELKEPKWKVDLGDTVYKLTSLTQNFRYGRGAGVKVKEEKWQTGVHYTQNTFSNSYNPKELASFFGISPRPEFSLSLNYLHKIVQENPTANIASVKTDINFPIGSHTEIELGRCFIDSSRGKNAFHIQTRGRFLDDIWYTAEKIYAGAAFLGYYQNVNATSATIDFPLHRQVRGNVNVNTSWQNYENSVNNTVSTLSPRQRQLTTNLTYNITSSTSLILNSVLLRAEDEGIDHQFDFLRKSGTATLVFNKKGYQVNSYASLGEQTNYLTNIKSALVQQYYLFIGKQFNPSVYASVFCDTGNTSYSNSLNWQSNFGTALRFIYRANSSIDLYAQKSNATTNIFHLTQASFKWKHVFKNGHYLQTWAQYFGSPSGALTERLFRISYTIPLFVPVGKKKTIGNVVGRVYDSWNNAPISNALVNLKGGRVWTDSEGRFAFSNVDAGDQEIKTEILPENFIPQDTAVGSINVKGGKKTEIAIPVVPACSLSGEVVVYTFKEGDSFEEELSSRQMVKKGGLKNMRVIISGEGEKVVYTTITDAKGHFHFSNLKPGNWRVIFKKSHLPDLHYVRQNEFEIYVTPDEEKHVVLEVFPEERRIQFMSEAR